MDRHRSSRPIPVFTPICLLSLSESVPERRAGGVSPLSSRAVAHRIGGGRPPLARTRHFWNRLLQVFHRSLPQPCREKPAVRGRKTGHPRSRPDRPGRPEPDPESHPPRVQSRLSNDPKLSIDRLPIDVLFHAAMKVFSVGRPRHPHDRHGPRRRRERHGHPGGGRVQPRSGRRHKAERRLQSRSDRNTVAVPVITSVEGSGTAPNPPPPPPPLRGTRIVLGVKLNSSV